METVKIMSREVPVMHEIPQGWKITRGAQTAPKGYEWIDNNKSRFGGERKTALLKIHGSNK